MSRAARDAYELYTALAEEKNIRLTCEVTSDIEVRGDRNLLFQAITNLLDNAIKYTPAGGRVAISLTREDERPVATVSDTGPGIPPEHRDEVTQRFFRIDASRSAPGAGLGLSLVKAIAQRHGIQLQLEDNRPGLRVRLVFPEERK